MPHVSPRLKPWLRLPAFAINGIEVALGIALIQLAAATLAGPQAAALVVSGAVCASIAHLANTPVRTWHRVGAAALLSVLAALVVELLRAQPLALGLAIGAIAFVAMMTLAWGARAGAVSFAPLLATVFAMAVPPSAHGAQGAAWIAGGAAAYLGWALVSGAACQPRYRTLALVEALGATAELFRSRADVLGSAGSEGTPATPLRAWIRDEARLAERLQIARDFLFAAPPGARGERDIGVLLRAIDLRDVLLASRLDADLLGSDATGQAIRQTVAGALRTIAERLDAAAEHVRDGTRPADRAGEPAHAALERLGVPADEPRARLLPSLRDRVRRLDEDARALDRLLQGEPARLPLTREQLQAFVAPEGWPLAALPPHLTGTSPVLRHAVRMALALATAYYLALLLPWGAHPYWLVLGVAVVLRGKLGETLARRNARVAGTILGCLVVVVLSHVATPAALNGVFIVALGTAHAFVMRLYWLTATAASVMALLQAHAVDPGSGFAIGERVADTLLGALLAWSFSYVLPSWERRSVRESVGRVLRDLLSYATHSLQPGRGDPVEERLARRRAYDSLSALAAALQRSRVEPRGVRLPSREIATVLDHGERLMAHLSMVRMTLARLKDERDSAGRVDPLLAGASGELARRLDLRAPPVEPQPARSADLALLPERPAADDPTPWLERRLGLLIDEAAQIQRAARSALGR
ncbi:FUSC family protein [Piscinibacter koreensis]|uniref:FUSC family protein n=1 Tax=Piscinibacter koreensis TaxID=2742824 RepID=A0A7Y6NMG1_9BURK|nr:FUSC family membrane protein [Schlegelella koreensis]NUZ05847.1 FUSC family protein [Schlegelella koreensis]